MRGGETDKEGDIESSTYICTLYTRIRVSLMLSSVVQFHPTKLQLYSAADDYLIRAWDLETSQCVAVLEMGHSSVVTSLQISPDGNTLYRLVSTDTVVPL